MTDLKVSLVSGRTKISDNKLKTTKVDISQFIKPGKIFIEINSYFNTKINIIKSKRNIFITLKSIYCK